MKKKSTLTMSGNNEFPIEQKQSNKWLRQVKHECFPGARFILKGDFDDSFSSDHMLFVSSILLSFDYNPLEPCVVQNDTQKGISIQQPAFVFFALMADTTYGKGCAFANRAEHSEWIRKLNPKFSNVEIIGRILSEYSKMLTQNGKNGQDNCFDLHYCVRYMVITTKDEEQVVILDFYH